MCPTLFAFHSSDSFFCCGLYDRYAKYVSIISHLSASDSLMTVALYKYIYLFTCLHTCTYQVTISNEVRYTANK